MRIAETPFPQEGEIWCKKGHSSYRVTIEFADAYFEVVRFTMPNGDSCTFEWPQFRTIYRKVKK